VNGKYPTTHPPSRFRPGVTITNWLEGKLDPKVGMKEEMKNLHRQ
jgi:hypothetical protein